MKNINSGESISSVVSFFLHHFAAFVQKHTYPQVKHLNIITHVIYKYKGKHFFFSLYSSIPFCVKVTEVIIICNVRVLKVKIKVDSYSKEEN